MFADMRGKAVCLLCGDSVAVMKEYKVRGHYETKHELIFHLFNDLCCFIGNNFRAVLMPGSIYSISSFQFVFNFFFVSEPVRPLTWSIF